MLQRQREEEAHHRFVIRPLPVPTSTIEPRFQLLQDKNKRRSESIKRDSVEKLQATQVSIPSLHHIRFTLTTPTPPPPLISAHSLSSQQTSNALQVMPPPPSAAPAALRLLQPKPKPWQTVKQPNLLCLCSVPRMFPTGSESLSRLILRLKSEHEKRSAPVASRTRLPPSALLQPR